MLRVNVHTSEMLKNVRRHQRENRRKLVRLLNEVGRRTIEYLQSHTNEVVQPDPIAPEDWERVRAQVEARWEKSLNDPDPERRRSARSRVETRIRQNISSIRAKRRKRAKRPRRPGHWADRTGDLAESYAYVVTQTNRSVELAITNDARHAHLVEALDGYFVVRDVARKGGPVDDALRKAVKEIAPEWQVK